MNFLELSGVVALTDLSPDQVREWTVRRKLILPEKLPSGPGSRAKFSWRSVLLLRLLSELHRDFGIELERARPIMTAAAMDLANLGFLGLWGRRFVVSRRGRCSFELPARVAESFISLDLDRHLNVISHGFSVAPPERQLTLFPATPVASP